MKSAVCSIALSSFSFASIGPLWQQLGNGLEAEQQTVEALQQSVVKLPRNPCALAHTRLKRHVELMLQLQDTPLVRRPQQRHKEDRAEGAEPIRLVVRRSDGKIQLCGTIVPDAVTIACDHVKGILSRRQIRVERLPARAGVLPITVIAVEPIAKLHLLWNQKLGRGVINLHVPRVGRELEVMQLLRIPFGQRLTIRMYVTAGSAFCESLDGSTICTTNPVRKPHAPIRRVRRRIEGRPACGRAPSKTS